MFDPSMVTSMIKTQAPSFLLARLQSVIMGVVAAYVFFMVFFGGPERFHTRVWETAVAAAVAYGCARAVRWGIAFVVAKLDPEKEAADRAAKQQQQQQQATNGSTSSSAVSAAAAAAGTDSGANGSAGGSASYSAAATATGKNASSGKPSAAGGSGAGKKSGNTNLTALD